MSVDELVERSAYREKIKFLFANQQLASTILHPYGIQPCCFGTAAYVVGAVERCKRFWQQKGNELDDYSSAAGDFICIPDDNVPGYMGSEPMSYFLSTRTPGNKTPGEIVGFSWESPRAEFFGFELRHVAIYLGRNEYDDFFFEQESQGKPFRISTLVGLVQELGNDELPSLRVKWYKPDI